MDANIDKGCFGVDITQPAIGEHVSGVYPVQIGRLIFQLVYNRKGEGERSTFKTLYYNTKYICLFCITV